MRKILLSLSLLILIIANSKLSGQSVNGYARVFIEDTEYKEGYDIYGIGRVLRDELSKLGFEIYDNNTIFPPEVRNNKCLLLFCSYTHSEPIRGTDGIVQISFADCTGKIIYVENGITASGSPWDVVFQTSCKRSLNRLKREYKYNPFQREKLTKPMISESMQSAENENSLRAYLENEKISDLEGIFVAHKASQNEVSKIGIKLDGNHYNILVLESGSVFTETGTIQGTLEETAISGLYSVKWYKDLESYYLTTAIMSGNGILIIGDEEDANQKLFIRTFPLENKSIVSNQADIEILGTGTGFLIGSMGYIATNFHVIDNSNEVTVTFRSNSGEIIYPAEVALKDPENDIAILKISDMENLVFKDIPYRFNTGVSSGTEVYTVGYPLNSILGSQLKVSDGIISSVGGILNDPRYLQITVPVQPGNSGGPLLTKKGELVGITALKLAGNSIENVNFAVRIGYLLNLIDVLPIELASNNTNQLVEKDLPEQVEILEDFICLVTSYR